jgi:hypothetical protein
MTLEKLNEKNNAVINLISPVGNTNQRMGVHGPLNISEGGGGQVPWRSKHSLLTGHIRREPYLNISKKKVLLHLCYPIVRSVYEQNVDVKQTILHGLNQELLPEWR